MESNTKKKKEEDTKKLTKQQQKELENFSKELVKKISVAQKKPKGFFSRMNPVLIVFTSIVVSFVLFGLLSGLTVSETKNLSLSEVVDGIESNKFSEIVVQNDGTVIAKEKSYLLANSDDNSEGNSLESANKPSEVTIEKLLEKSENKSALEKIRAFFGRKSDTITEILVGKDFIIGIEDNGQEVKSYVVKDITFDEFEDYVSDKKIDLSDVVITKLEIYAEEISSSSLRDREDTKQLSFVLDINDLQIAKINDENLVTYKVDWTPSIYSFADTLVNLGIDINNGQFILVTENVPAGVSFSDILTILTIIIFVVLAVVIFRSAQASGMGIMQFGQSRAKMFFGQKTDVSFSDVAGIDEAREELNEIVDFLKSPAKYRKMGARIPKGVLMVGPPGTGKTLLARAIAGEAGVPFFHTSGSEFEEMLVGAGASRVRDLFSKAKKAAPSLIFIDEIDAIARKRGTRIQSGTTEQTLNQILVEMDGFEKNINVIVLAATNRPDVLDPAILRPGRFDRQVSIDVPDKDGRLEILKIHGKNKPFSKDVDLEKIAKRTVGFTGADLENILNEAAIIAAKEGRTEISTETIDEAVSKVILGPAKKSRKRDEEELRLVAYHEAGHALVAKLTKNAIPVDKISITSRGSSGGVTMFLPEKDENIISKGRLYADIVVSLGGRAAEEVVLGDISTGASNDIQKATQVARRMIQKFGMSPKLGLVQYGVSTDSGYLGYAYDDMKDYSEKTAEIIDEEVRSIVGKAYEDALSIVTKNRAKLDKIAGLLLEKEVMEKEEFNSLFE